ncbi:MAG: protein kinase [Planctomycetes bacterium]|nr:protein kinase [Planctomycetota bacterium]
MTSPEPPDPLVGQTIGGCRIEARIGQGGMGIVYRGRRQGETVALKVLPPNLAGDRRYLSRFLREGKAAAAVRHANVVRVLEAGEDRGFYYLAMEHVEGESLAARLGGGRRLEPGEAASLARQAAIGLAAIHAAGIVHRDVKPGNLLAGRDGILKVADFGLARGEAFTTLSTAGQFLGTPAYMSPEQARGLRKVDRRADVYSLGTTLYHLLAGAPPFEAEDGMAVLLAHVSQPPPPLASRRPDAPPELASIVHRMIEKDPARRFPSMARVASALRDFLEENASTVLEPSRRRARRRLIPRTIAAGLAATLLVAGLLAWLARERAGDPGLRGKNGSSRPEPPGDGAAVVAFAWRLADRGEILEREGGGEETEEAVRLGLGWLARHQDPATGAWDPGGFAARCQGEACEGAGRSAWEAGESALALLAFLATGTTPAAGVHGEVVARAVDYFLSIQDADGCFGGQEGQFLYGHALSTLAVVEAFGVARDPRTGDAARRGVSFLLLAQNPGYGWRYRIRPGDSDTSATAWALLALWSARAAGLEVPAQAFEGALAWLDVATDPATGRTGYQAAGDLGTRFGDAAPRFENVETCTGVSLLVRLRSGEAPDSPVVARQRELLLACLPAWTEYRAQDAKSRIDYYYWHLGTLALFEHGGEAWQSWNEALKSALLPRQRRDGDAAGSWDPCDAWGMEAGRIYATAINTLTLETYYRYERAR